MLEENSSGSKTSAQDKSKSLITDAGQKQNADAGSVRAKGTKKRRSKKNVQDQVEHNGQEWTGGDGKRKRLRLNESQKALLQKIRAIIKIRITYRELECSKLLVSGCSMVQIARQLNISPRTAEYYINSLKLKCDCDNKWQLSNFLQKKFRIHLASDLDLTLLNSENDQTAIFRLIKIDDSEYRISLDSSDNDIGD